MIAAELIWRVDALIVLLPVTFHLRRSYRRRYVRYHWHCHGSLVVSLRDGLPPVDATGHAPWCDRSSTQVNSSW